MLIFVAQDCTKPLQMNLVGWKEIDFPNVIIVDFDYIVVLKDFVGPIAKPFSDFPDEGLLEGFIEVGTSDITVYHLNHWRYLLAVCISIIYLY